MAAASETKPEVVRPVDLTEEQITLHIQEVKKYFVEKDESASCIASLHALAQHLLSKPDQLRKVIKELVTIEGIGGSEFWLAFSKRPIQAKENFGVKTIAALCLCDYAEQEKFLKEIRAQEGVISLLCFVVQHFPIKSPLRKLFFSTLENLIDVDCLTQDQSRRYISELTLGLNATAKTLKAAIHGSLPLERLYDCQHRIILSLGRLASDKENQNVILRGGGLDSLLALIKHPGTNDRVKIATLTVLNNFDTPAHELSQYLQPVIPVLHILLTHTNIALQKQSLRLLARRSCPCCSQEDIGKVSSFEAQALADLLESDTLRIQRDSVAVIKMIAGSSTANKKTLYATMIIENLIALLDHEDLDLQREVVGALYCLASKNANKKDKDNSEVLRVVKMGRDQIGEAIPKIVALLVESSDKGMQCVTLAALSTLVFNHPENQAKLIAKRKVFHRMIELLRTGDDDVKIQVASSLGDMAYTDSPRKNGVARNSVPILRAMLNAGAIAAFKDILDHPPNPAEMITMLQKSMTILEKQDEKDKEREHAAASEDKPVTCNFSQMARDANRSLKAIFRLQDKLKNPAYLSAESREALLIINEDRWAAAAAEYGATADKKAYMEAHPDFLEALKSVHQELRALEAEHTAAANKERAEQLRIVREAEEAAKQAEAVRAAAQKTDEFQKRVSKMQKTCVKFNARVQPLAAYQDEEFSKLVQGTFFRRTREIAALSLEALAAKIREELVRDPTWFDCLKNLMLTAEQTIIRLEAIVARRAEEAALAAAIRAADAAAEAEAASTAVPAIVADDLPAPAVTAVGSAGSDDDHSHSNGSVLEGSVLEDSVLEDSVLEPAVTAPGMGSPEGPTGASPAGAGLIIWRSYEMRPFALNLPAQRPGQAELETALAFYGYRKSGLSPTLEAIDQFYKNKRALIQKLGGAERTLWAHMGFHVTPKHFELSALESANHRDVLSFLYFRDSGKENAENRSFSWLQANMRRIDFHALAAKNKEQVINTIQELLTYLSLDLSDEARAMVVADLAEAAKSIPLIRTRALREVRNQVFHGRPVDPETTAKVINQLDAALVKVAAVLNPVAPVAAAPAEEAKEMYWGLDPEGTHTLCDIFDEPPAPAARVAATIFTPRPVQTGSGLRAGAKPFVPRTNL